MTPPVLFLIFKRPDKTQAVFETIRAARPPRLYVGADGPRPDRPGEAELCEQTRAIIQGVDWPCEVKTLFRSDNLGCQKAVSGAVTWFFQHEAEGVILEDDIVVDPTFFPFAAQMLDRYRDTPDVMSITACNMQPQDRHYDASYYFSCFNHVWGWASWRRAWVHFDASLDDLETDAAQHTIVSACPAEGSDSYWLNALRRVRDGHTDTWDIPWLFSQWKAGGLTVTPSINLMQNIGFDETGTHTTSPDQWEAGLRASPLPFPLTHPERIEQNVEADTHVARNVFHIKPVSLSKRLRRWLRGQPNP